MMVIRLLVLAAAIAASACVTSDSPTGPDAVAGQPFDLKARASSLLPDGTRLKFEVVRSDSRCPMDALCVSAGEAIVVVTLQSSRGAPASRELQTPPSGSPISYGGYTIALTALAPYPRSGQGIALEDYVATFVVTTTSPR